MGTEEVDNSELAEMMQECGSFCPDEAAVQNATMKGLDLSTIKEYLSQLKEVMRLYDERGRRYKIVWVKGHADNRYNVLVDGLVNEAMDLFEDEMFGESCKACKVAK